MSLLIGRAGKQTYPPLLLRNTTFFSCCESVLSSSTCQHFLHPICCLFCRNDLQVLRISSCRTYLMHIYLLQCMYHYLHLHCARVRQFAIILCQTLPLTQMSLLWCVLQCALASMSSVCRQFWNKTICLLTIACNQRCLEDFALTTIGINIKQKPVFTKPILCS